MGPNLVIEDTVVNLPYVLFEGSIYYFSEPSRGYKKMSYRIDSHGKPGRPSDAGKCFPLEFFFGDHAVKEIGNE